ncbi:C40 family peptidase [Melioribacteraceae bacterium 4301-Me]|uniref:C40 family peptidase n=1 Tax=Pyranulibacter aquaticus TaxID=3163344 RepID=UPI00359610C2
MKNTKSFILILWPVFIFLVLSCSSSSYSERYSKSNESEEKSNSNSVKFTSEKNGAVKDTANDFITTSSLNNGPEISVYDNQTSDSTEFDVPPPQNSDSPFETKKFIENYEKLKSFNVALTPREKILFEIIKFIDTPYKYGGNSDNGIDCSAFTREIFESSVSIELPRTASEQFKVGKKVNNKNDLQFGDLIFFNTTRKSYPGHVGIYLGDDKFVHASRSLGVTISTLDEPYYKQRYVGARRIENIPLN